MSHASATIKTLSNKFFYGEYNGTVDIMIPFVYETPEERNDKWRQYSHDWKEWQCNCGPNKEIELCEIYSYYGGGFYWQGKICINCKKLIEGCDNNSIHETQIDGKPDWLNNNE